MRKAGPLAAAVLLALALCAPGCKPSSLTPFGVGTRNYEDTTDNVNGDWLGETASGGEVVFQVGNDTVSNLSVIHIEGACTLTFDAESDTATLVDDAFTFEIALTQGTAVVTGSFTSSTTASGTYSFEGLQTGGCTSSGSGSFTATKTQ